MTAQAFRRAAAAAALGCLLAAGSAHAQAPLLPDLQPLTLEEGQNIDLYSDGGDAILDVGFRAANVGSGPLELQPLAEPAPSDPAADCDGDGDPANDRPERQNVYLDGNGNSVFDPGDDTDVQSRTDGCLVYHPGHSHWHAAVMTTDILPEQSSEVARALDKPTFCMVDLGIFDSGMPGFDPSGPYPLGGCSTTAAQGISVGWYDEYWVGLSGQQIDVTGLAAGNYCVRQEFDGDGSIDELDDTNNTAHTRISINPAALDLQVLGGSCQLVAPDPVVDTTPPDTRLVGAPGAVVRTKRSRARVRFDFLATEPGATLQCSLDGKPFVACGSPRKAKLRARRGDGRRHSFQVRAGDAAGNFDASPARWAGRVKRKD